MRISDWSSDVCSSDLAISLESVAYPLGAAQRRHVRIRDVVLGQCDIKGALGEAALARERQFAHVDHGEYSDLFESPQDPFQGLTLVTDGVKMLCMVHGLE